MNPVMFNAAFYLEQNADVAAAVAAGTFPSALAHFQQFGQFELRDPNAFFDTSFYLTENPDVLQGLAAGTITSAFQHFVQFGQAEGIVRAPSAEFEGFDEALYLSANPDVAAAVANGTFANGFQHFLQFGVAEDRPGTGIDEGSRLASALNDLNEANANIDVVLENAARLVAENDGVERTDAQLDTFIEEFGSDDLALALSAATTAVADDRIALTGAQNALDGQPTQATLNANLATAQRDLLADTAGAELLGERTAANAALARDVAADGSNEAVLTNLRNAVQGLINSGANSATTTVSVEGANTISLAQLIFQLDTILATEGPDGTPLDAATRQENIDNAAENFALGADAPTVDAGGGGSAAARATLNAQLSVADQRADLLSEATTAQENLEAARTAGVDATPAELATAADVDAFLNAEEAIVARQEAVAAVATAQAELADSLELLAGLRAAENDLATATEARDAIADAIAEEFGTINVVDGDSDIGTEGDDIFVFDAEAGDLTISGFGVSGDDVLFVGRGFAPVEVADNVDFAATAQGNVGALEIFIQQDGVNTVLFIEEETFDGSTSTGTFGGSTITLAGVDADTVTIDANGFLRVTPEAEALVA